MYAQALAHFKKVDPVLYRAGKDLDIAEIKPLAPKEYFSDLCDSIVSQQLSTKVAQVIWGRVVALFPDKKVTPQAITNSTHDQLRGCGLSNAKARYIRDLAERTAAGEIKFAEFPKLTNEEITKELVAVKGIGPWTAEMFLMFTMGKPDIFSPGDLGLKNAMAKLPGLKKPDVWSPFRSYACRILWKTLES